jgi:hypothetical protein
MVGTMHVTVAGAPVRTIPLTLSQSGEIPVVVREEFTSETTSSRPVFISEGKGGESRIPLNLYLQQIGSFRNVGAQNKTAGDGSESLVLQAVPEGTYRVVAQAHRGYVASVQSHGVDLMRRPLVVGPSGSSDPIEVTLRDDNKATVTGTITGWVPPAANASWGPWGSLVMFLPLDNLMARGQLGAGSMDGTFTLDNVPPGEYLVLASRVPQMNLEFRDEEAMKRYAGKGTRVTVTTGEQKLDIQVPMLDEGENLLTGSEN